MAQNIFESDPSIQSALEGGGSKEETRSDGGAPFDPEMMRRIGGIMSSFSQRDERSEFIRALRPHLSPERQRRADNAIRILKIMRVLPSLGDLNIL